MQNSCVSQGLRKPTIEEFADGFRVIFYRETVSGPEKATSESSSDFLPIKAQLLVSGVTPIYIRNIESVFNQVGGSCL